MTRQWAYGMVLLLGLTAAGLAQALEGSKVGMVAGMLPPAPAGYERQEIQIITPESPAGSVDLIQSYKPLGSTSPFDAITLIVTGTFSDAPPGIGQPLPDWATLPAGSWIDGSYRTSQRQGFGETRLAVTADDPSLKLVAYQIDISFIALYLQNITAIRWAAPPFRAEEFQPLEALLNQIDMQAMCTDVGWWSIEEADAVCP